MNPREQLGEEYYRRRDEMHRRHYAENVALWRWYEEELKRIEDESTHERSTPIEHPDHRSDG